MSRGRLPIALLVAGLSMLACGPSSTPVRQAYERVGTGMDLARLGAAFPYALDVSPEFASLEDARSLARRDRDAAGFVGALVLDGVGDAWEKRARVEFKAGRVVSRREGLQVGDEAILKTAALRGSSLQETLARLPRAVPARVDRYPRRVRLPADDGRLAGFSGILYRIEVDRKGLSETFEVFIRNGLVTGKNYVLKDY